MTPIRTVVVDDEATARSYLRRLLAKHPDFEVVAEASQGTEAVQCIEREHPDVLFLDIQMPGFDGFEILRLLDGSEVPPVIVFVTAYDAHALRAFEAQALDYLLKPFDEERFDQCLAKIRTHWSGANIPLGDSRVRATLELMRRPSPVDRLVLRQKDRILLLPVEEVDWISADDNYVRIHARGDSHLHRESLSSLEARLNPGRFIRIHRSTIVNLARIVSLEPLFNGEFRVNLSTGDGLTLSRRLRPQLERVLGKL